MSHVHATITEIEDLIRRYENRLKICRLREAEAQKQDQDQDQEQSDSQRSSDVMVESSEEESLASNGTPDQPDNQMHHLQNMSRLRVPKPGLPVTVWLSWLRRKSSFWRALILLVAQPVMRPL